MTFERLSSTTRYFARNPVLRIVTANLAAILLTISMASSAGAQAKKPAATQSARERVDLLVSAEYVVTMDATRRVIEDGAIAVRGDAILAVGPRAELEA